MYKKIKNLLSKFVFVLLVAVTSSVSANEIIANGDDVTKYFKQTKIVASYYKKATEKVEFYNSTKTPKLDESVLTNFKTNSTVSIDIDFLLKEKDNGEAYKSGDWFTVPLDGTLIDYPEMDIPQYINVDGKKILKFYVKKINSKPVVYFEFTEDLTPNKYDFFENGKINIYGKVENKLEGTQSTIIGEDSITIDFDKIEKEDKTPGTTGEVIPYKLFETPIKYDFRKKVLSSSITSDIINYEFSINQNLVSKYYTNKSTNIERENLVLVDQLSDGLIFKDDTFNLEVKILMPCIGYKYNGNDLVLENGRPVILGLSNKKVFMFDFKEKFNRIYQGNESNAKFLEKIKNKKYSIGITKDGKEFYLNLGDIGTNGYVIDKIKTDKLFKEYLDTTIGTTMDSSTNKNLKNFVIEDMLDLYGSKSKTPFKGMSFRVRASAEKTSYDVEGYTNSATLNYNADENIVLEDSVFSKNYKTTASITPGAYNSITISKSDEDNNDIKLEGVKFNLYKEGSNKIIDEAITNELGMAVFNRLDAGVKYRVKEVTAKAGYDVNSYKATLSNGYEFDSDGFIQIDNKPGRQGVVIYATNKLVTHTVNLIKKSENGELLDETTFELLVKNGNKWVSIGSKTTNKNGEITFEGLLDGTYKFIELKAKAGYSKDSFKLFNGDEEISTFTLNSKNSNSKKVIFTATNKLLTHSVSLTKYGVNSNNQNKVLGNVKFALFVKNNDRWTLVESGITNELGRVDFNNLLPGTYRFEEVQSLTGYLANSFKLYSRSNVLFDEDGLLESVNLEKAIKEFTINSDLTEETVFEFVGTNLEIPVSNNKFPVFNRYNSYLLPQTGDNFNKINWLLLAIVSGSILLISNYRKIRN